MSVWNQVLGRRAGTVLALALLLVAAQHGSLVGQATSEGSVRSSLRETLAELDNREVTLGFAFAGGGAKGAFGAGVIYGLLSRYPDLEYGVVSGTSTGALIAPFVSLAQIGSEACRRPPGAMDGEENSCLERLKHLYTTTRRKDVVRSNLRFPRILALPFDLPRGLTHLAPLDRLLRAELGENVLKKLAHAPGPPVVTLVNLQRGLLELCTTGDDYFRKRIEEWFEKYKGPWGYVPRICDDSSFRKSLLASSSIPVAIAPTRLGSYDFVDGGVADKAPLDAALAAGATHVLVTMMSPPPPRPEAGRDYRNFIQVGLRSLELLQDEALRDDLDQIRSEQAFLRAFRVLTRLSTDPAVPEESRESLSRVLDGWRDDRSNGDTILRALARGSSEAYLVAPACPLGATMDFNSEVPKDWPETCKSSEEIPIMEARFNYGVRTIERLLGSDAGIRDLLGPFSRGSFSAANERPVSTPTCCSE